MLAPENPRLAGYMLIGNRSMFQETDGSVSWFYHYAKVHLPFHTMIQCNDKIPEHCREKNQFVDPFTRQTYPNATVQNCSDRIKKTPDTHQHLPLYTRTHLQCSGLRILTQLSFNLLRITRCRDFYPKRALKISGQHFYQCCFKDGSKKISKKNLVYTTDQEGTDDSCYYSLKPSSLSIK